MCVGKGGQSGGERFAGGIGLARVRELLLRGYTFKVLREELLADGPGGG